MRRGAGAPALSVLIPALDEAAALPTLLAALAEQQGLVFEVIVSDGGSRDATLHLAAQHSARGIAAPRGRGAQLNAAVAAAQADWLLCLHADSQLTHPHQLARALACLEAEARDDPDVAGHWPLRFTREASGHGRLFRHLEAKSASNRPGTVNGDQGLLIHRDFLLALGGFDTTLPFFEDTRLATKVFTEGRFVCLPGVLGTSARRFEREGHATRLALMALMMGADAAGLADWLAATPALYRAQGDAARLSLKPFLHALDAHLARLPPAARGEVMRRAAQYTLDNRWQLAFALRTQGAPRGAGALDAVLEALAAQPFATRLCAAALSATIRLGARLPL